MKGAGSDIDYNPAPLHFVTQAVNEPVKYHFQERKKNKFMRLEFLLFRDSIKIGSDYFTENFQLRENKTKMRNIHPRFFHLLF